MSATLAQPGLSLSLSLPSGRGEREGGAALAGSGWRGSDPLPATARHAPTPELADARQMPNLQGGGGAGRKADGVTWVLSRARFHWRSSEPGVHHEVISSPDFLCCF